ncbi:SRPBCC family protein [Crocinitomix catalasitica]|nr:SRPBCC family protein [Crocinitomix catalasitica]
MKYVVEKDIDLPRERVIELFDSTENLYKWQAELISFDHLSGEPGEVGAKSKLIYKMKKREFELIETITKKNLPDEFDGTYDAKGVHNIMENRFEATSENQTKWIVTTDFQFSGFMKFMAAFMPGAFKKRTNRFMDQFKEFAEGEK